MCPDRDLVSAYVDGEVPSPWRERLEEHLGSCAKCASLAASYSALGDRLRAEFAADEAASLARGRARLEALLEGQPEPGERGMPRRDAGGRSDNEAPRKSWRRSVSLPLPLAAAAALLVLLLGGTTALLALRPSKGTAIQAVASGEIAPPSSQARAQPASMDELLRYLDAQGGQVTLTIKLPNETTFGSAGKPVIMRSGQVLRGTTVGGSSP
jgi:anti-sigma factor RsiW